MHLFMPRGLGYDNSYVMEGGINGMDNDSD